jgi:hypothetical protein
MDGCTWGLVVGLVVLRINEEDERRGQPCVSRGVVCTPRQVQSARRAISWRGKRGNSIIANLAAVDTAHCRTGPATRSKIGRWCCCAWRDSRAGIATRARARGPQSSAGLRSFPPAACRLPPGPGKQLSVCDLDYAAAVPLLGAVQVMYKRPSPEIKLIFSSAPSGSCGTTHDRSAVRPRLVSPPRPALCGRTARVVPVVQVAICLPRCLPRAAAADGGNALKTLD